MSKEYISDFDYETKQLAMEIKENEAKYISGELSLDQSLKKTDELYESSFAVAEKTTANRVLQDSGLMQLQSKIIRQCAKSYKPDALVFDCRLFSQKLRKYYCPLKADDTDKKTVKQVNYTVWQKLGEESRKHMHVTPTFNFLYGTFKPDPVSPVKKKRKRVEKDKIADVVKPQTVSLSDNSEGKDIMLSRATRILSIFLKLTQRSNKSSLCFYEFVIDPKSFTRTIENIFTVSLLVQNGHLCIFPDEQGLPCIRYVKENERRERLIGGNQRTQSIVTMSVEEWKAIIKKFKFTQGLIPPPRSQAKAHDES